MSTTLVPPTKTGLDPLIIAQYVELGHALSQNIATHQTEFVVGMREIDRCCAMAEHLVTIGDPTPMSSAFVKTIRRACRLYSQDLLVHLDSLAEKTFRNEYARAKAAENDRKSSMTALDEFTFALSKGWAVLLVGPSGRGKTWIAHNHDIAPDRLVKIAMTPQTEESPLYGNLVFNTATQAYEHQDGPVVDAVANGKRIVVDEITTAPADISHMWHQVANREAVQVKTNNYRNVEIHPDFQLVGTTNLEGYGGNYRLSPAFYSRFHSIEWFGMTVAEETAHFVRKYLNEEI